MFGSLTICEILAVTETAATTCCGHFSGTPCTVFTVSSYEDNTKPGHSRWSFTQSDKQEQETALT